MADFVVPRAEGETKAEYAVKYILTRMNYDPNFRHYMLHTGAMEACVAARAEATGLSEKEIANAIIHTTSHHVADRPEVVRLRQEVETLAASVGSLEHTIESARDRERAEETASKDRLAIMAIEDLVRDADLGIGELTTEALRDVLEKHTC